MAVSRTILLKGDGVFKEGNAGGAITPGHLLTRNATANQVVVHATAAAKAPALFALENDVVGKDIADAYASGERVLTVVAAPGSELYALLPAAAAAIVVGDFLESNGDGTLRKRTPFSQSGTTPFAVTPEGHSVARALEAVDNSGGGTPARIRVEVV